MIDQGFYLADESIAERAGVKQSAYVTADGKFVLNSQQLKFMHLTPEEYITGLKGVEKVDFETAERLIAENGYLHFGEERKNKEEKEGEE